MLIFHRKVEKTITNDGQNVQKKFEKKKKFQQSYCKMKILVTLQTKSFFSRTN